MFIHWGGRTFHTVGSDQCLQDEVMTSFRNNQHTVTFTPGLGRGEMTISETEGGSSCVVHTGQRGTPGLRYVLPFSRPTVWGVGGWHGTVDTARKGLGRI